MLLKNNGYIIMSGISGRRYYIPNYEEYISYKQIISQGRLLAKYTT